MYTLASLPFAYVFSFIPKTSIMGFTNFFILNVIICVIDAVINSFPVFMSNSTPSSGPSKSYTAITNLRYVFAFLLPTVNLKHALSNLILHANNDCITVNNAMLGTSFSTTAAYMSTQKPGVGTEFILFCIQIALWWLILCAIENRLRIRQCCQRCCSEDDSMLTGGWNDSV
jgi:hypothetical protein